MAEANDGKGRWSPDDSEREGIDAYLSLNETNQKERTKRYLIICITICVCLGVIAWMVVKMADTSPWKVLAVLLASLLLPAVPGFRWVMKFRAHIKKHHHRQLELEAAVDGERTSSGLNPDGSSPDDH